MFGTQLLYETIQDCHMAASMQLKAVGTGTPAPSSGMTARLESSIKQHREIHTQKIIIQFEHMYSSSYLMQSPSKSTVYRILYLVSHIITRKMGTDHEMNRGNGRRENAHPTKLPKCL